MDEVLWKRTLHVSASDRTRFNGLFNWGELNRLLQDTPVEGERLRLMREGKDITDRVTVATEGRTNGRALQIADLYDAIRGGATLNLNGVDASSPQVRDLAWDLTNELRERVWVNAYASFLPTPGLALHWDDHDVFVLQISGRKHWTLFGSERRRPVGPATSAEEAVVTSQGYELFWDGTLEPGDVLYLPAGWWHRAVAGDGPSLHLTLGVRFDLAADALTWAINNLAMLPAFRVELPKSRPDHLHNGFAKTKRDLIAAIDANFETLLERYCQERAARQLYLPAVHFPSGPFPEGSSTVPELLESVCRFPTTVERDTGCLRFSALGKRWSLEGPDALVMGLFLIEHRRSLAQLTSALDLAEEELLSTVRRLLALGLVAPSRHHEAAKHHKPDMGTLEQEEGGVWQLQ